MSPQSISENTLFYGDNLNVLREYIASESIDLIYLDSPFNSNRNYNVLFKDESGSESEAQITAFEDTWHWNQAAAQGYEELVTQAPPHVAKMIGAMRDFVSLNQMMAYLVMMAVRLVELHRVLKPTGSLYLHCDQTASHYLKIILDTIFGPEQFRNEIIWRRANAHNDPKRYGRISDTILYYTKTLAPTWNAQYTPYRDEYYQSHFKKDEHGRYYRTVALDAPRHGEGSPALLYEWHGKKPVASRTWAVRREIMEEYEKQGLLLYTRTGTPTLLQYADEMSGVPLQNIWTDIPPVNPQALERLGYPTQKPLALLERIITASSNAGDVVLDPFCGCGTAIAAAQKLDRRWIGIDITHLSIALQKYRLESMFPGIQFRVIGEPRDSAAARQLAREDRYQFQWWALSLIRAKPLGGQEGSKTGKKGSDQGIDGVITFIDDAYSKPQRVLVQVKSGHVGSRDIRDLVGTVQRENAAIGVFITLEEPSGPMLLEAASAGYYESPGWGQKYPRLQIKTIADLLKGAKVEMPPQYGTFKQARRVRESAGVQVELEM